MLVQALYFASLTLFGFVVFAGRRIPDGTFILACIIPVFLAAAIGIIIWVYAWTEFGAPLGIGALLLAWAIVWAFARIASTRALFVLIYVAMTGGLVCARFAMQGIGP
jgi:hypothetical protein